MFNHRIILGARTKITETSMQMVADVTQCVSSVELHQFYRLRF